VTGGVGVVELDRISLVILSYSGRPRFHPREGRLLLSVFGDESLEIVVHQ